MPRTNMPRTNAPRASTHSVSTITRIAGLALASALSATAVLPTTAAQAKPKFSFSVQIGAPVLGLGHGYVSAYGVYNPCRWLKQKYYRTGNPEWLDRYYACLDAYY